MTLFSLYVVVIVEILIPNLISLLLRKRNFFNNSAKKLI